MSRIKSELISNLEITDINCCNTPYIIRERGQSICINCGIVQEEKVIENNPVPIYDSYDVVKKKHSDFSKAFGSSTMFKVGTDYKGNSLHSNARYFFIRALRIHNSIMGSAARNYCLFQPYFRRLKTLNLFLFLFLRN